MSRAAVSLAEFDRTKTLLNLVLNSVGPLLSALRRANGRCMLCDAQMGGRHNANCAAWPLILTRQEVQTGESVVHLALDDATNSPTTTKGVQATRSEPIGAAEGMRPAIDTAAPVVRGME